jgi:GcrA cell cycle regulator
MWTDKRVDVLRTDWASGATARQIAQKLGGFEHLADRGKNAVIGKLHRLGLARSSETNAQRLGRIDKRRRAHRAAAAASAARVKPIAPPVVATLPTIDTPRLPAPDVALVASVMDLKDNHCRWPVGTGFCGCQQTRGSYCAAHNDRAWAKRRDGSQPVWVRYGAYQSRLII